MQNDYDSDLQSYFTDMERQRIMFKEFIAAEKLPKRLIVFHGVGGVGKSSLLRMFRLHCKSEKIPVALASGDDSKSVLDVIMRWTDDLKAEGVKFAALSKTLETYRAIQAKVEDQVKKSQNKVVDIASKAASKTAEAAGGALLGAAIGSIIPGIGTAIGGALGGVVSGMGAEALTDWLRGFLSKPDIDLLLNPAKKLSADFLEDITKAAEKKRMVLLLDTFEQMSALEDWVGETAQKIHPNVLMVIAGRKLPNWSRVWHDWMMNAQVEELKPMTADIMRQLIQRYYATMRGGEPDLAQVEAIIKFARGLPMVVTSAVQLWVKYGMEDFQSVKAEIVANLVDRLMEGVPSALIPALEAAAVVRWFDQPILRAVMNKDDVRDLYNELRRFPFVRTRVEGLALHDSVREMMDENLRVQDSERHAELHECAAAYFEKQLEKVTGEEVERLSLERLYHRVYADENAGMKLFQEIAEKMGRYRLSNQLRVLLNDVNTYSINGTNWKLWRNYYNAHLLLTGAKWKEAEPFLREIAFREKIDSLLIAYAQSDLGEIMSMYDKLVLAENPMSAVHLLEMSLQHNLIDQHLSQSFFRLARIARFQGDWDQERTLLNNAKTFFEGENDNYGLIVTLTEMKRSDARRGMWRHFIDLHNQAEVIIKDIGTNFQTLQAQHKGTWVIAWALFGRLLECEEKSRECLKLGEEIEDIFLRIRTFRHLGWTLGRQGKMRDATLAFEESLKLIRNIGEEQFPIDHAATIGEWGITLIQDGQLDKARELITKSIQIKNRLNYRNSISENFSALGNILELQRNYLEAEQNFREALNYKDIGRYYHDCIAYTGLVRVKYAQGDIAAIPSLLAEAEQLAQQYEYNDHLASLRLTQGHLISPPTPLLQGEGSLSALDYYKQAMIYALRYNRFLLDELLSGRPQGTPLRPIIPYCLERGEEGKKILSALWDWWQTGVNDVGTPRPDTISPIPEGIPLLEAEKLARQREPGDGSIQRSVVEQLEAGIGN